MLLTAMTVTLPTTPYQFGKGLTNGISHKRKAKTVVVESKKKQRVIVGHTDFRVKLDKQKGGSYCRMCYRNQKGAVGTDGKKLTAEEKKMKCNWSYMGCTECGEQVCDVCWEKGYDKHQSL
jgi:hypothetical protein